MIERSKWKSVCQGIDGLVCAASMLAIALLFAFTSGILLGVMRAHGLNEAIAPVAFGSGILLLCILFARHILMASADWMRRKSYRVVAISERAFTVVAVAICVTAALFGAIIESTQQVLLIMVDVAVVIFVTLTLSRLAVGFVYGKPI